MQIMIAGIVILMHASVVPGSVSDVFSEPVSDVHSPAHSPQPEPNGRLVVTLERNNEVAILDAATGVLTARIEGLAAPHEVIADGRGRWAFVAEAGATTVAEIDLATARISRRFELGNGISPHDLVLNADESVLWVASGDADVVVPIDRNRGTTGAPIPTRSAGSWMIARLGDGRVVTANLDGGSVSVMSLGGDAVHVVGPTANAMALVEPFPGTLWVGDAQSDTLVWIDVQAGAVIRRSSLSGNASVRLRRVPDRDDIAMVAGNRLVMLEPRSADIVATIPLPHPAKNVAFSHDGHWAFITHPGNDAVTTVDLAEGVVVRTVSVDGIPDSVAWVPAVRAPQPSRRVATRPS